MCIFDKKGLLISILFETDFTYRIRWSLIDIFVIKVVVVNVHFGHIIPEIKKKKKNGLSQ